MVSLRGHTGALSGAPALVEAITHLTAFRGFAGTSVLIMVGVATDTARYVCVCTRVRLHLPRLKEAFQNYCTKLFGAAHKIANNVLTMTIEGVKGGCLALNKTLKGAA